MTAVYNFRRFTMKKISLIFSEIDAKIRSKEPVGIASDAGRIIKPSCAIKFTIGVKMKFICRVLILLFVVLVSNSYAGSQGGTFKVTKLRLGGDGVHVAFSPAPADCNGGDHYRTHARLSKSIDNYEAIFSALLTAYTTGNTLSYIWYADLPSGVQACSNSGGYLGLNMIELSNK